MKGDLVSRAPLGSHAERLGELSQGEVLLDAGAWILTEQRG